MKWKYKYLLAYLSLASYISTFSQQGVSLQYAIIYNPIVMDLQGKAVTTPNLKMTGKVFQLGNEILSYSVAHYLEQYPQGTLSVMGSDNKEVGTTLKMDSIQSARYYNMDSMFFITRVDNPKTMLSNPNEIRNYYFPFELGHQPWQLLPDEITINNWHCKRAILKNAANQIVYDFWYTEEMPISLSPVGYTELPGLVVKGTIPVFGYTFEIDKYDFKSNINHNELWLKELDPPYKRNPLVRAKK